LFFSLPFAAGCLLLPRSTNFITFVSGAQGWTSWHRRAHTAVGIVAVVVIAIGTYTTTENLVKGIAEHGGAFHC